MIRLTLELPDKALSPNARLHWAAKARAVRAARRTAWLTAYVVGLLVAFAISIRKDG